jgi:hypothetical protein
MPRPPPARLIQADRSGLPGWCDRFLHDPAAGEFFASRAWYDTLIGHALPAGEPPALAVDGAGAVLLPLRRVDGALAALTSPYTLDWRPLPAPGADAAMLRAAGQGIGRLLRGGRPVTLDLLDAEAPGLAPLLAGFAAARLRALRYDHTGNCHETLPPGTGWESYLAARPPALRTTIARKLARAARDSVFEPAAAPGAALEAGIVAYAQVRALSWKPEEPFPAFDAALMRAAAALGLLRLGVLRDRADGAPVAAQYWILDRGRRRATVLKLSHVEGRKAASPGTVLTALMIRRLLEEDGVAALDFGRGDDAYKLLWVGARRQRIGVVLADPLHPAGLAAIARQALGAARRRWLSR